MNLRNLLNCILLLGAFTWAETVDGLTLKVYNHEREAEEVHAVPHVYVFGNSRATFTVEEGMWNVGTFSGIGHYTTATVGFNRSDAIKVSASMWGGKDTAYMFKDYTGNWSVSIEEPKQLYLLNPWKNSKPAISVNGGEPIGMPSAMYTGSQGEDYQCGWFKVMLKASDATATLAFSDVNFGDVWGAAGGGDSSPVDVSGVLDTSDQVWVWPVPQPFGIPNMSSNYPGIDGKCGYKLGMIVRDWSYKRDDFQLRFDPKNGEFSGVQNGAINAGCSTYSSATTGMVQNTLDAEHKPQPVSTDICKNQKVGEWFRNDPVIKNDTCVQIAMHQNTLGQWEYNSFWDEDQKVFMPINNYNVHNEQGLVAWVNGIEPDQYIWPGKVIEGLSAWYNGYDWVVDLPEKKNNFHFCTETIAEFNYRSGQTFLFAGGDDFWMFIDGQLTLDIGGIHHNVADSVVMSDLATLRGWKEGSRHEIRMFHCERQTEVSNFGIMTNIHLEQKRAMLIEEGVNGALTVKKREGFDQNNACSVLDSGNPEVIVDAELIWILEGNGHSDTLAIGSTQYPGISIISSNEAQIDTSVFMKSVQSGFYVLKGVQFDQHELEFSRPIFVQSTIEASSSIQLSSSSVTEEQSSEIASSMTTEVVDKGQMKWNVELEGSYLNINSGGEVKIEVLSAMGKQLSSYFYVLNQNESVQVNVAQGLSTGLYFVKIDTEIGERTLNFYVH